MKRKESYCNNVWDIITPKFVTVRGDVGAATNSCFD